MPVDEARQQHIGAKAQQVHCRQCGQHRRRERIAAGDESLGQYRRQYRDGARTDPVPAMARVVYGVVHEQRRQGVDQHVGRGREPAQGQMDGHQEQLPAPPRQPQEHAVASRLGIDQQRERVPDRSCPTQACGQARAHRRVEAAVEQPGEHDRQGQGQAHRLAQLPLGRVARLAGKADETILQPLQEWLRVRVCVSAAGAHVSLLSIDRLRAAAVGATMKVVGGP